jgi:DNA-binding response OmpR family regulator
MLFASRVRGTAASTGVAVITAARTDRFLEQAKATRPRLFLIDLELRGQDVPALIRAIKADDTLSTTPLIAFASHMNADAIAAGRAAGADRVLARSAFVQALPALLHNL